MWTMLEQSGYQTTGQPVIEQSILISELLFVKEYQEDGKIIFKFVKSEDNEAGIFTKNTTNTIFQNHQKKLVWDKGEVNNEGSQEHSQNEIQQEGC